MEQKKKPMAVIAKKKNRASLIIDLICIHGFFSMKCTTLYIPTWSLPN